MEMMLYSILSVNQDSGKLDSLLLGMKGISDTELYAVTYDEISAVVGDINKGGLVANSINAMAYATIIEALSQSFTLLPMRFGSVMESALPVIKMLERNYQNFEQNLQKVKNKHEFGLKIFCDPEQLMLELSARSDVVLPPPAASGAEIKNSVYREWVNRKLYEHRLEELKLAYIETVITAISECANQMNAHYKLKKMASSANIVDALFLLDKEKKTDLIQAIEDLQKRYPGLKFVLTGPWPPYNFVETTIK